MHILVQYMTVHSLYMCKCDYLARVMQFPPSPLSPDVSGGYHPSVFDALRLSVQCSKVLGFSRGSEYTAISHNEALYMATLGGARGERPAMCVCVCVCVCAYMYVHVHVVCMYFMWYRF